MDSAGGGGVSGAKLHEPFDFVIDIPNCFLEVFYVLVGVAWLILETRTPKIFDGVTDAEISVSGNLDTLNA